MPRLQRCAIPFSIHPQPARAPHAFTLLELLVVVGIIGVILGLLIPTLSKANTSARTTKCEANLHNIALASNMYLDDFRDSFWQYYKPATYNGVAGRNWWFGFEANGPGAGLNRPLDPSKHFLAAYASATVDRFQCPEFPWTHAKYNSKFAVRAATYGYNDKLSGGNNSLSSYLVRPATRKAYDLRADSVIVFLDAVQFEATPTAATTKFNEGHYVSPTSGYWGYAHYRHAGFTAATFIDGHVALQKSPATPVTTAGGFPVANLTSEIGTDTIYGY